MLGFGSIGQYSIGEYLVAGGEVSVDWTPATIAMASSLAASSGSMVSFTASLAFASSLGATSGARVDFTTDIALASTLSASGGSLVTMSAADLAIAPSSLAAYSGARAEIVTNLIVYHDPAIGESSIGTPADTTPLVVLPTISLASLQSLSAGVNVQRATIDLALTLISIEPIVRARRTTVQVLES